MQGPETLIGTHRQFSQALQTRLRWSWIGFEPESEGICWSWARFFLLEEADGWSESGMMREMVVWGRASVHKARLRLKRAVGRADRPRMADTPKSTEKHVTSSKTSFALTLPEHSTLSLQILFVSMPLGQCGCVLSYAETVLYSRTTRTRTKPALLLLFLGTSLLHALESYIDLHTYRFIAI